MATFQSVQSTTSLSSQSVTVTKPVGLAVGDLLLAGVWGDRDDSSNITLNTPAGWSLIESEEQATHALEIYSKVADSADVAASNFTFTSAGGSTPDLIAHVLRITNYAFDSGSTSGANTSSGSVTATTFTPTRANCLYVLFHGGSDTGGTPTQSLGGFATDNPSWTNQASNAANGGTYDSRFTVYTATRAQATATGTVTASQTLLANNRMAMAVVGLAPVANGSLTAPDILANAYAYTGVQSAKVNAISDDVTTNTSKYTGWQNETPPTTNWVNETL